MLPSEIFCVTEEEKSLIKKNHGKSEEEIETYLNELKDWVKTQPHIPEDQDDTLLRMIIELNKFNMDKAKKKLDMFYAIRNIVPDFYNNRSSLTEHMKDLRKRFIFMPLPKLHSQQRIYLVQFKVCDDPGSFDVLNVARHTFLLYDLRIHYDPAGEEIVICDLQNMKLHHVIRLSPLVVTRIYSVLEKGYSDRVKGIHFINVPTIANIFVSLVKYIFSFKLQNRVHIHKDLKSLQDKIPLECLPSDYDGKLNSVKELTENWTRFIESKDEWLVEQGQKRTNEKLRPESSKSPGMFNSILQIFKKQKQSNEAPL